MARQSDRNGRARWRGFAGIALALALVAGACGDDDDADDATDEAPADEADAGDGDSSSGGGDGNEEFANPDEGVEADSIKVSAWYFVEGAAAQTLPGPLKVWESAVRYYNDEGGVNGRMYDAKPTNSELNCGVGVANVRQAIEEDHVFAFAGGFNPYMSSCVGPVMDEFEVPAIITDGIDPTILEHEYVFPIGSTHYRYTRLALRYAKEELGAETAMIVTHSDATFDAVVDGAEEVMGDGLIGTERIAYDESNMAPLVQRMADRDPDAVYFYVNPDRLIPILGEMERQGFRPSKGMVGGASLYVNLIPQVVGDFAEGMIANSWVAVPGSPSAGIKEVEAAVARYEPDASIDGYSTGGYAAFRLFHNVVKSLGREVTRERLVDALYELENYDNAGLEPPLTFTRENREAHRGVQFAEIRDGSFQFLQDWTLDE